MSTNINPYKDVHKGIRKMLLELVLQSGQTDINDTNSLKALHTRFTQVHDLLEIHSEIENKLLSPLIQESGLGDELIQVEGAHQKLHVQMSNLSQQLDDMMGGTSTPGDDQRFYLALSHYVSQQLLHMAEEEEVLWPRLSQHCEDASMVLVQNKAREMMPPATMQILLKAMISAINHTERSRMLSNLKRSLSAEAFSGLCQLTQTVLPTDDWQKITHHLGLNTTAA